MIKSHFSYCPLIWILSSRKANNLIKKVRERHIWKIIGDNESNFEILLEKINEITVHQRNLKVLMTEVHKVINEYAWPITGNYFMCRENTHNFRNFAITLNKNKKTVSYGSETISYRTPLLLVNLPEEYKLTNYLSEFKSKTKSWKYDTCLSLSVMPTFPSEFRF